MKDGWDGFIVFCSPQRQISLLIDLQMTIFIIIGVETGRYIIAFNICLSYGFSKLDVHARTKIQGLGRCSSW